MQPESHGLLFLFFARVSEGGLCEGSPSFKSLIRQVIVVIRPGGAETSCSSNRSLVTMGVLDDHR